MPALIVAPTAGFDSYASVAEADAYMASVGYANWAGMAQTDKETALRRGSQYIGGRQLVYEAVYPTVNPNVKAATCEAAQRHVLGTLYKDVDSQAVKSVSVGPISRTFADPVNGGQPRFPIIDDLLYGLTFRAKASINFDRA